jgi:hypothetical protein
MRGHSPRWSASPGLTFPGVRKRPAVAARQGLQLPSEPESARPRPARPRRLDRVAASFGEPDQRRVLRPPVAAVRQAITRVELKGARAGARDKFNPLTRAGARGHYRHRLGGLVAPLFGRTGRQRPGRTHGIHCPNRRNLGSQPLQAEAGLL